MSFGEELRRERELRQITLREISESTKISLRYLEALERNEFEGLPGGVFNRGFVRAYAQFIGVDPEAMVNAYLLQEQAQSSPGTGDGHLLRRLRSKTVREGDRKPTAPVLRWVLLALALITILAGLYFALRAWGPLEIGDSGAPPASTATEPGGSTLAAGTAPGEQVE